MLVNIFSTISNAISFDPLLGLVIFIALVFFAWNLTLHWQVWQTTKKIRLMFKGKEVADLEGVIFEQIKRLRQNEKNLKELEKFSKNLEKIARKSIQKTGVVRFNPFKDMGGDQSSSIALLDDHNSGLVISSLFTREGTRIYTKPIEQGSSKYQLTEEEKEAIKQANKDEKN